MSEKLGKGRLVAASGKPEHLLNPFAMRCAAICHVTRSFLALCCPVLGSR